MNGRELSVVKSNYGLNGSLQLHHSGGLLRSLRDRDARERIEEEREIIDRWYQAGGQW